MSIWQNSVNPLRDEPLTTAQEGQATVAELVAWWHTFRAAHTVSQETKERTG